MFTVTSNPLPMQPQMFTTLGEIVVHWSRIESALDQEISTMRRYALVRKLADVVPHTFSKKLELWRRSVRALYPSINTYQQYADAFVEAVKKVAKFRNHLIHGTWSLNENEKGEFLVMNYRSVRGEERHDTLWVGQEVLDNLLADVQNLSAVITGFVVTKMIHAHEGLLRAQSASSPDHQAQPNPATPEIPKPPPESSEE
ncbi:MAG TPA: hypothetical protein VMN38_10350 [Sphingomicrobium sp.]|nr:hypothetical protein [Sphingomicrobium sp.]